MRSTEKVLLSVYAADKEAQQHELEYQLYHTLIFYLAHVRGFSFPGYTFSPFSWDDLDAFISLQLAKDTAELCGKRWFALSSPTVLITDKGRTVAEELIPNFRDEDRQYDELRDAVTEALAAPRHYFLRECYEAYIRGRGG